MHVLAILSQKMVSTIPSKYVLDRQRKDMGKRHTYITEHSKDLRTMLRAAQFDRIYKLFLDIVEMGTQSDYRYEVIMRG